MSAGDKTSNQSINSTNNWAFLRELNLYTIGPFVKDLLVDCRSNKAKTDEFYPLNVFTHVHHCAIAICLQPGSGLTFLDPQHQILICSDNVL